MRSTRDSREGDGGRLRAGLSLVAGAALLMYPVLMYLGETRFGTQWLALGVIVVSLLRVAVSRFAPANARGAFGARELVFICAGAIILALLSLWNRSSQALLYYPVLVNGILLFAFALSLVFPPTIVERIARLRDKHLPLEALPYLRRVTAAWCVFFVINGAIALYTVNASIETWTLYNGLIAYLLIGAMFAGEFLIRLRAMRGFRK